MKFIKILILLSSLTVILNSCAGFGEAGKVLRNEKRTTTDEFLIKKNEPLTRPPNYEKIPKPGSAEDKSVSSQAKIEKILKGSQPESGNKKTKLSSTEEFILNQIKK
jgi:hypothetical protein